MPEGDTALESPFLKSEIMESFLVVDQGLKRLSSVIPVTQELHTIF